LGIIDLKMKTGIPATGIERRSLGPIRPDHPERSKEKMAAVGKV
jgi:hypothetical protein